MLIGINGGYFPAICRVCLLYPWIKTSWLKFLILRAPEQNYNLESIWNLFRGHQVQEISMEATADKSEGKRRRRSVPEGNFVVILTENSGVLLYKQSL